MTAIWIALSVAFACTALNVAVAVVLMRLSLPARFQARLDVLEAVITRSTGKVDEIEREAKLWKTTITGLIEEAENAFSRAERKRASAASTASRLQLAAEPEPVTRAEKLASMRKGRQ